MELWCVAHFFLKPFERISDWRVQGGKPKKMKTRLNFLWSDPRNLQIAILSTFLIYGIGWLDWGFNVDLYAAIIGAGMLTQWIGIRITRGSMHSLKSGLITVLGLCLLFKTNLLWVGALAAAGSIAIKYLLRIDGKHFFNPSNFGIVAAILLTGEAWISPGQWGSGAMLIFAIGGAAMLVTIRVRRLATGIVFFSVLFALEYARTVLYLGWSHDVLFHKFSSGSLLLFTFFMITDPVTTPRHPKARLLWAATVAFTAFTMTHWFYLYTAPLYALIICAPLTPWVNRRFPAQRFRWSKHTTNVQLKTQLS